MQQPSARATTWQAERLGHLYLDDSSAGALGLALHHETANMALNGDSCLVHDVCAHGVQDSHLTASQEHLCIPSMSSFRLLQLDRINPCCRQHYLLHLRASHRTAGWGSDKSCVSRQLHDLQTCSFVVPENKSFPVLVTPAEIFTRVAVSVSTDRLYSF